MNTEGLTIMSLERRDETGKITSLAGGKTTGGTVIELDARDDLRWRCSCGKTGRWRSSVEDKWPRVTLAMLWHRHLEKAHSEFAQVSNRSARRLTPLT